MGSQLFGAFQQGGGGGPAPIGSQETERCGRGRWGEGWGG